MKASWDDSEFEQMSWHDNHVHGLAVREGNYGHGELDLDLDYIVEWVCPTGEPATFRLAPVTLTFREVSDLRIEIDYASVTAGMYPFSLAGIEREASRFPGRYRWRLVINWPTGSITFEAEGFSQVLRKAPIESREQCLRPDER